MGLSLQYGSLQLAEVVTFKLLLSTFSVAAEE
jgi:hypothetical protein